MELQQVQTLLESANPQNRMKAMVELRHHEPDVVVPLLKRCLNDKEFIVRSFVAMGLGYKQTEEGFTTLLGIIENERDSNVIAEAANSLAKFGDRAIPYLMELFERQENWLIRESIFAALEEMLPPDERVLLCRSALEGTEPVVKQTAIGNLYLLRDTHQAEAALDMLLEASVDPQPEVRAQAARILRHYDGPQAQAALIELRQDRDHRVVGATLEGLL